MQALVGATLIDGRGNAPIPDSVVLVDGDHIVSAGPRASTSVPRNAGVVDLAGLTLLPGLIDTHDHLAMHGYGLAQRWGLEEPGSTTHLRTGGVLDRTLAMGYTTVRDAGGLDAGFKLAVEEGLVTGPRLALSLQIISPTGGIGDRVSPSGHTCWVPADPALPDSVANGIDQVRTVVRSMIRAGADVIKCATTGGASSRAGHGPKDPAFTRDEMRVLVEEAHALGRKVMCHAIGGPGLRMAIEAGVDSIEHGSYLADEPDLLHLMAERGTFFTPTLLVYVYHRESASPHVRTRARALYARHLESVAMAREAGRQDLGGNRRRRPRPSGQCARARVPRRGGASADGGAAHGHGLGRGVPGLGARPRHRRERPLADLRRGGRRPARATSRSCRIPSASRSSGRAGPSAVDRRIAR